MVKIRLKRMGMKKKPFYRLVVTDSRNPDILNASRKRRIAAGSGTTVQEVNLLLKQFEQARSMMKNMMGGMKKGKMKNLMNRFGK